MNVMKISLGTRLFQTTTIIFRQNRPLLVSLFIVLFPILTFSQLKLDKPLLSKWNYKGQATNGPFFIQNSRVILPQTDGSIVALDLSSGRLLWRAAIGGDIKSYAAINNELALVSSSTKGDRSNTLYYLNALRVDNGVTVWRINLKFPFTLNNPSPLKHILISQERNALSTLYNVKRETGETSPINSFLTTPDKKIQLSDELVIVKTKETQLDAFNLFTGKRLWTFQSPAEINSFQVLSKETLYLATNNGEVISLNTTTGSLAWQKKASSKIQILVPTNEGVIAITPENKFFLYTAKGKLKWKKLIEGRISSNLTVHDSYLIIFPTGSNIGIILSLKNGKTLNRILLEPDQFVLAPPIVTDQILFLLTQKQLLALANK